MLPFPCYLLYNPYNTDSVIQTPFPFPSHLSFTSRLFPTALPTTTNTLHSAKLGFQRGLRVEICLSLALETLLLDVADYALVHCLFTNMLAWVTLLRVRRGSDWKGRRGWFRGDEGGEGRTYGFLGALGVVYKYYCAEGEGGCCEEGEF